MSKFYMMVYDNIKDDFIDVDEFPESINRSAVLLSEFQFLNQDLVILKTSENAGIEFPDYFDKNGYKLFSDKLKRVLDNNRVKNIYYKPIKIVDELTNRTELYWLAVVERIYCIDEEKSQYDDTLSFKVLKKIVIKENRVGNYNIFKLKEDGCDEIIITDYLKDVLEKEILRGLQFIKVD